VNARGAVAFGVALLAMLCAGLWLGGHPSKLPTVLRGPFVDDAAGLTAEAAGLIEDNYYRPVRGGQLTDSSLRGMVRGLRRRYRDRFTEYFSPEGLTAFNEAISGRFSGVGLAVTRVRRGLRVDRVFAGAPAERAGIEVGDVIVSVDGDSIAGESSKAATAKIKGPEGTEVTLGVLRPPTGKTRRLRLTRAEVALPIVTSRVETVDGRKLGYVRLATFSEGSHGPLREAVRRVERRGAEGVVLDLRANGGGLLEEAVLAASIFLPEGETVVSTESRTQGGTVHRTVGGNLPPRPVVVLVDRNTASAAEILTAALADNADAEVIGTRSFGKGVFQQEVDLSNGGALKLTIGEYFTPEGKNLAGRGIQPDVKARDMPGTSADEALRRAFRALAARQGQ